jgi:hypothetical protein
MFQFQVEQISRDFTGDVIRGGTESAGDENYFGLGQRSLDRLADRVTVGNGDLALNPQAKRENFPSDEPQMRIQNVAEEQLGAGIDDDHTHWEKTSNAQRPTSNAELRKDFRSLARGPTPTLNSRFGVRRWAFGVFFAFATPRLCPASSE